MLRVAAFETYRGGPFVKLSIVIPTRERSQYLGAAISTVLRSDDPDIDLVVSDNASADETAEVVAGFDDPRLTYVNTGQRVSMRKNFENGLAAATGDYVIYFGDDDGLLPGQIPALRMLIDRHQPDVLSWPILTYGWIDKGTKDKRGGVRFVKKRLFGEGARVSDSGLAEALLACRMNDLMTIPRLYHGCVKMSYLESGRLPDGEYFGSTIPDYYHIYHSILRGGNFWEVDHAFSLNGFSKVSTGSGHRTDRLEGKENRAGKMFASEVQEDPKKDVIEHALNVAYTFFATFESVRALWPNTEQTADYGAWYAYVLGELDGIAPELKQQITTNLKEYAQKTGTQEAFQTAVRDDAGGESKTAKVARKLKEAYGKRHSFRRLAQIDGQNTVNTASMMFDNVTGDLFEQVLKGEMSRDAAWAEAKRRGQTYPKQLSLR